MEKKPSEIPIPIEEVQKKHSEILIPIKEVQKKHSEILIPIKEVQKTFRNSDPHKEAKKYSGLLVLTENTEKSKKFSTPLGCQ